MKEIIIILLIIYGISALFGLSGFVIDIIRYPQPHKKVKIIPSAEEAAAVREEQDETEEGLTLDEATEIEL